MIIRVLGGIIIVFACGGFGFMMAAAYKKEISMLREFVFVLDFMECELQYRQTPLPELCRLAAIQAHGALRKMFLSLTNELEDKLSADVAQCMNVALNQNQGLPKQIQHLFGLLGSNLGRFDMEGQLKGLESVRQECRRNLNILNTNGDIKIRNLQTLGLCAGAALAILFI